MQPDKVPGQLTERSLPLDILLEIFVHLPAHSLKRLSCAFDDFEWVKNTIQDPSFVKRHTFNMVKNPKHTRLMFQSDAKKGTFTSFDLNSLLPKKPNITSTSVFRVEYDLVYNLADCLVKKWCRSSLIFNYESTIVIGASHGLVCLAINGSNQFGNHIDRSPTYLSPLVIWNPFTQENYILRSGYILTNPRTSLRSSKTKFGFGYDSVNDSFKIVIGKGCLTEIYDLSSNSWTRIDRIDWDDLKDEQRGHFLEGALHWITSDNKIMALDLVTNVLTYFTLPVRSFNSHVTFGLGVLENRLVLAVSRIHSKEVGIWAMEEYGREDSWTNLYHVEKSKELGKNVSLRPPIWISEDGKLLFEVDCRLVFWQPDTKMFTFTTNYMSKKVRGGITYVDTLVSPKPNVKTNHSKPSKKIFLRRKHSSTVGTSHQL